MKKMLFSAVAFAVVAVSAVAVAPTTSEAVPAFARQTGAACLNCHFQAIPRLAAFGRAFKLGGFRDMGEQALLEDDHLSLPATFNASLLFKARIGTNKTIGGQLNKTGIQWPDEAAFLVGGRYGENIGGLTEWSGGPLSYKIAFVYDLDAGQVGIVGGSTDALGVPYLMNDPSNVTVRNLRGWQHRAGFINGNNFQANGASGLAAYFTNDMLYVGLGLAIPNAGTNPANPIWAELKPSTFVRAAWMGELAGMDAVIGGTYASVKPGVANAALFGANDATSVTTQVDVQLQGDLGDVSVGFYLPYQFKGEDWTTTTAAGAVSDFRGYYPVLNVAFGHMGVRLGYDYTKENISGATTKTTVLGGWYSLAQNVELDLEYNSTKTAAATTNVTTLVLEYVY